MDFNDVKPYIERMVKAEEKIAKIKFAFANLQTEQLDLTKKKDREKASTFLFALDYLLNDKSIEDYLEG